MQMMGSVFILFGFHQRIFRIAGECTLSLYYRVIEEMKMRVAIAINLQEQNEYLGMEGRQ